MGIPTTDSSSIGGSVYKPIGPTLVELKQEHSEQVARIAVLEKQMEALMLHPGYIAKAGPADQQALALAEQLFKLNKDFVAVERENSKVWSLLADFQQKINELSAASVADRLGARTAEGIRSNRG